MARLNATTNSLLDLIGDESLRERLRAEVIREATEAFDYGYKRGHEDLRGRAVVAIEQMRHDDPEDA